MAVFVAGSFAFLFWPFVFRWIVAPYFVITGFGGLSRILDYDFSVWVALSMLLLFVQGVVGIQLFRIKREPVQPLLRNAGSHPSSDDSSVAETPSSLGPRS